MCCRSLARAVPNSNLLSERECRCDSNSGRAVCTHPMSEARFCRLFGHIRRTPPLLSSTRCRWIAGLWRSGRQRTAYLADTKVPVILVEAEKSVLSIVDACTRTNRRTRALIVGTGGCWGWRGTTGKTTGPNGARVDEKGPLPDFDLITWTDRDVAIVFDSNAATNMNVQAVRRALATELGKRAATVRFADIPVESGCNGPDDYIRTHGAAALFGLIDAARPVPRRPPARP